MNFTSVTFLFFFLPAVVALYFALPSGGEKRARNGLLLAASLLFYAWGEGTYLALLLVSIGMNHVLSHAVAKNRKPWLAIGIAANLAMLVVFKYLDLIVDTVGLTDFGVEKPDGVQGIFRLPLGISFFTFQAISLLIDVGRGNAPAKNVFRTGLYIAMFPQLVAGPIVRWDEIRVQITERSETWDRFCSGLQLMMLGLAQKVLIADVVAVVADNAFGAEAGSLSAGAAWLGLAAFTIQIFYDFAGYSNMAIGMGRIFGFELPRNFEHPYSASSFREFWRRWHMTLSRWFRDYLYIPLGGSREGRFATYRNLLIVFVLCGLWHGANWTFLLWGLWHGVFLIGERVARRTGFPALPRVVGVAYTVLFVALGWVLFRADSLPDALAYWGDLLPGEGARIDVPETAVYALIIGAFLAWDRTARWGEGLNPDSTLGVSLRWVGVLMLAVLCFAAVASSTVQSFIYFVF